MKLFDFLKKGETETAQTKQSSLDTENDIPVNKHPEFLNHLKFIDECLSYLIHEFDFKTTLNQWVSYEYTTIYKKGNIEILIVYTPGMEAEVSIVNTDLPLDESNNVSNSDFIGHCNLITASKLKNKLLNGSGVIQIPLSIKP